MLEVKGSCLLMKGQLLFCCRINYCYLTLLPNPSAVYSFYLAFNEIKLPLICIVNVLYTIMLLPSQIDFLDIDISKSLRGLKASGPLYLDYSIVHMTSLLHANYFCTCFLWHSRHYRMRRQHSVTFFLQWIKLWITVI